MLPWVTFYPKVSVWQIAFGYFLEPRKYVCLDVRVEVEIVLGARSPYPHLISTPRDSVPQFVEPIAMARPSLLNVA